jgi:hypothetical protein
VILNNMSKSLIALNSIKADNFLSSWISTCQDCCTPIVVWMIREENEWAGHLRKVSRLTLL